MNTFFFFFALYTTTKIAYATLNRFAYFEQDKSSDIIHQPPFVNCIKSNTLPQMRKGATKPTGTSYLRSLILFHNYCESGADPGIFARGGPTILKILKSKNKTRQEGEREVGFSIYSALVWLKSIFAIETAL